jgi:hypothetical protein
MNDFKQHIVGYRKGGKTCPCCVEFKDKQLSRRVARRRMKAAAIREMSREARATQPEDGKIGG